MSSSDSDEQVSARKPVIYSKTGLPQMSKDAKAEGKKGAVKMIIGLLLAPRIIGFLLAFLIYRLGEKVYDKRMANIENLQFTTELEIGYLFLSLAVFSMLTDLLNKLPMLYKQQVMSAEAGNLRANQLIFKVNDDDNQYPAVVLQEDGEVGMYNRANRALHQFNENALPVALNIVALSFIFSLPVFILTICYAIARVWYQMAYASGGYGMGFCQHATPFMLHGFLLPAILEGLCWGTGVFMLHD